MHGKIGIEEHFAHPYTPGGSEVYLTADLWPEME